MSATLPRATVIQPRWLAFGAVALLLLLSTIVVRPAPAVHLTPPLLASPMAASPVAADWLPAEQPGAVPVSLLIRNKGSQPDTLLEAESNIAARIEPVVSEGFGAHRRLLRLPAGIPLPPDRSILLEPASAHLLLVGLQRNLVQGETFPLTLRFAEAGELTVTVRVRRKLDAAGVPPIPPVSSGLIEVSLVSVPPAGVPPLDPE